MAKKIFCNMCGRVFGVFDEQQAFSFDQDIGYGSKFDGMHLNLDLCCSCMDSIIEKCKIRPVLDLENYEVTPD